MRNFIFFVFLLCPTVGAAQTISYRDTTLPLEVRVNDLVGRMTIQEKISQMTNSSAAVERLGIPRYEWWNECLHGVGRSSKKVTVFPQAIALAATFNAEQLERSAEMISDEARAIYNEAASKGQGTVRYEGLTFWTPNVNIFRDPRWGRGQETYGEDPYLTGLMGSAMVRGLEGNHPTYLKVSACAKHFAVHSGPESNRHSFNATASPHDLWDTYLPAFRTLVQDANVSSVMCAYNRLDGQPCCGSDLLLRQILLYQWGFKGYVTSDCWAIPDFYTNHKTHPDVESAAADAVLHGTDLECGNDYASLMQALEKGLITEQQIDVSVRRLMTIRFRLGMFDPSENVPYSSIPISILENTSHRQQALLMAQQSMVLLSNARNTLPLNPKRTKKIVLLGPNADNEQTQLGNYNGFPTENITIREALQAMPDIEVVYHQATDFVSPTKDSASLEQVLSSVKSADLVIFVGGISPTLEGEAGDAGNDNVNGFVGGDRDHIELPAVQTQMMKKVRAMGKPLVFVCMSGSAVAFAWEAENADAIIQAWYGGQAAGSAVVDLLFGRFNPSGRLPVTFYKSTDDLPAFEDYSMAMRTYRYFNGAVLYPFGYGLSFSDYRYSGFQVPERVSLGDTITVSVTVQNRGQRAGEEVVQLYTSNRTMAAEAPICALQAVQRIGLEASQKKVVTFHLTPQQLGYVDQNGTMTQRVGEVKIFVGGRNPNADARLFGPAPLESTIVLQ